ncbi:MAG: hypothetical protein WCL11_19295, partial [Verrucomicrobiota bacterium]
IHDSRLALERNDTSIPTDLNSNSALLPGIERALPLLSTDHSPSTHPAVSLPATRSQCTTTGTTPLRQVQHSSSLNRSDLDELLNNSHLLSANQRRFLKLVNDFKGHSKIRWKDTISEVINKHAK